MNWLILVAVAVVADAIRVFADNYITDVYFKGKESVSQKHFYGWFFVVMAIVMLFIFPVDFHTTPLYLIGFLVLAGCLNSLAGIPYYRAIEMDCIFNSRLGGSPRKLFATPTFRFCRDSLWPVSRYCYHQKKQSQTQNQSRYPSQSICHYFCGCKFNLCTSQRCHRNVFYSRHDFCLPR